MAIRILLYSKQKIVKIKLLPNEVNLKKLVKLKKIGYRALLMLKEGW
jgi:hypothetical protein